jgi:hypothetical protein
MLNGFANYENVKLNQQLEGVKQFQDYLGEQIKATQGQVQPDLNVYDKLSDWRNWMEKKEVHCDLTKK